MDKYRFLSTILYNIRGFGGIFHTQYRLTGNGCYRVFSISVYLIGRSTHLFFVDSGFRPELGNGDRFRPVNLKLGSPAIQIWGPISARNSEIETGDFGPELRNGDRFRPGTQKWRPILAQNSEMVTSDFSPELGNGDRDMDSWIIIQTATDRNKHKDNFIIIVTFSRTLHIT
ncbi:uncharacterized protein OCT59_006057 [Rhizophagus irregularis]|uniref:uncharacterized protein n=1 Tax=Rhizophagus irregularis TaxID=588596 RepID=UPI00332E9206|nr:hypothetical protein OCT59_006057 [Rhizophagus irregularis]